MNIAVELSKLNGVAELEQGFQAMGISEGFWAEVQDSLMHCTYLPPYILIEAEPAEPCSSKSIEKHRVDLTSGPVWIFGYEEEDFNEFATYLDAGSPDFIRQLSENGVTHFVALFKRQKFVLIPLCLKRAKAVLQ